MATTRLQVQHTQENRDFPWVVGYVWLGLVLFTHVWAALISPWRPFTFLERAFPLWPPLPPWSAWLKRVWLLPLQRWDVKFYLWIASRGYHLNDGTTQFHPLFPGLAAFFVGLGFDPLLALSIVSSVATLLLLWAFYRLVRLDFYPQSACIGTLLFLCSPYAFAFFVPYPEALFLLWAVLCFYWARRKHWGWASVAGALATLTRQQGVFLLLPLAWELWEDAERDWRRALAAFKSWLALFLIPVSYGIWVAYRAIVLNDLNPDFSSLHRAIYSLLISPDATYVVPDQTFMWPWKALGVAGLHLWQRPDVDIVLNFILGGYFLILLLLSWKQLRISYRIYTLVITLISFAYHTGAIHPYMGLPRHLLLGFPVFIGLIGPAQRRWVRWILLGLGFVGMLLALLAYVLEAWVS